MPKVFSGFRDKVPIVQWPQSFASVNGIGFDQIGGSFKLAVPN